MTMIPLLLNVLLVRDFILIVFMNRVGISLSMCIMMFQINYLF